SRHTSHSAHLYSQLPLPSQVVQGPQVLSQVSVAGSQRRQSSSKQAAAHSPATHAWQPVQVVSHAPLSGLHASQGPHDFGTQVLVAGLQTSHLLVQTTATHCPTAGSQVWQAPHFGTQTLLRHT